MSGRASIFENDDELDVGDFRPASAPRPRDGEDLAAVRRTAAAKGFVSREAIPNGPAAPPAAVRPPAPPAVPAPPAETSPQDTRLRRRRTGRDKQINLKITEACSNRFYALADSNGWGLGETLERAVAALELELQADARR